MGKERRENREPALTSYNFTKCELSRYWVLKETRNWGRYYCQRFILLPPGDRMTYIKDLENLAKILVNCMFATEALSRKPGKIF